MTNPSFATALIGNNTSHLCSELHGRYEKHVLPKSAFADAHSFSLLFPGCEARHGEEGFFLLPGTEHMGGSALVRFTDREDASLEIENPLLSLFAVKTERCAFIVFIERDYRYTLRSTLCGGVYSLSISIDLSDQQAEDDLVLYTLSLPTNADIPLIIKQTRAYYISEKGVPTLQTRCKERSAIDYSRRYPLIRIRMGWKPVPPTVLHQTPENEPPMLVAATFADVRSIADECHRQGLAGAEFSLVGWNQKGHDGRWPQIFPVEEALGGEDELKKTITHVKSLGYRITCHTNLIDHYEIADCFDRDALAYAKSGKARQIGMWAGGEAYHACPHTQLAYAERDLARVKALGFDGPHYIDVLSIMPPDACFHPSHPCTLREGIADMRRVMRRTTALFGGFCSEGAFDFALGELDFSLYNAFGSYAEPSIAKHPLCDAVFPLLETVIHGLLLYNPNASTVNYSIKDKNAAVTVALYGGRPTFYFYSKFVDTGTDFLAHVGTNWMGSTDLLCRNEAELTESVAAIVRAVKEYEPLADRQLVFIRSYEEKEDGLRIMTYEDGVSVVGNYTDATLPYQGVLIPPHEYRVMEEVHE